MASPFDSAGGIHDGSEYASLTMDRYITGLVTNRSPLRDAAVPYLYAKFYQAGRFDSLWDGLNTEITAKLTLARRPGHTVYNDQIFQPIRRFYPFIQQIDGQERVSVMVDCDAAVYDGTGPSTKKLIWTKSAGAGRTSFQGVGNTLYMGNGVDQIKMTVPVRSYQTLTTFTQGDFILDPNGNLQVAFGSTGTEIVQTSVTATSFIPGVGAIYQVNVFLASAPNMAIGETGYFTGLTVASFLNGTSFVYQGGTVLSWITISQSVAYGATHDTGLYYKATTNNATAGVTGAVAPAWNATLGGVTSDGSVQWINKGSNIQQWGTVSPTTAPTAVQSQVVTSYQNWRANTFYAPHRLFTDAAGTYALMTLGPTGLATTGAVEPVFNPTPGTTTVDNTVDWFTVATPNWQGIHVYAAGDLVIATINSVVYVFSCVTPGTSAAGSPAWRSTFGSQASDGGVTWVNCGPLLNWTAIGPNVTVSAATTILDSNGFLEDIEVAGISGGAEPAWPTTETAITTDNTATWVNGGAYAKASQNTVGYAFSYKSSVTLTESNMSPAVYVRVRARNRVTLAGPASTDPQIDTIVIYRTVDGGSTFLYDTEIPAPLPGSTTTWGYTDVAADTDLNIELQGAISPSNNPPPVGLIHLAYHDSRIWGSVGNLAYYCTGPDATVGAGNEAWDPGRVYAYPSAVGRLVPWDLPGGVMLVFTTSRPYAIWGLGTQAQPYYTKVFNQGGGLLNFDALDTSGPWIHMFTTDQRLLSFQPSAGYTAVDPDSDDAGAPIGDQFVKVTTGGIDEALYDPASAFVTFFSKGTNDTGLFVADGTAGWFRFSRVTQPETGFLWSPRAEIASGTSAVQSVETAPGINNLLIGPSVPGPILRRDTSASTDNGTPFDAWAVLGNIELCQPFELAEVAAVELDSAKTGTAPTVGVLFDEIEPTLEKPFIMLRKTGNDPVLLRASQTLNSERFMALQTGHSTDCRHMQMLVEFGVQDAPSELLSHSVYGRRKAERKAQT